MGLMLDDVNPNYNKGFAARKVLLGASAEVNCEIPLNRYSFFEELQDKLLPNVKIELQIEMENDRIPSPKRSSKKFPSGWGLVFCRFFLLTTLNEAYLK